MSRYSWNTAKVGVKHQSINQSCTKIQDLFENTQDTYTSVTRGHFLNNIYIRDMTEWTYDEK